MRSASRYHPVLVTLHWLLAVLIVAALVVGFAILASMDNAEPRKIVVLRVHMAVGTLILFLMIVRFVVRLRTARPAAANRPALVVHYGFYVLVILAAGTGFATAIAAGLPEIVFGNSGDPLPKSFAAYPAWQAHFWLGLLLAGVIVLHVLAALYHQFLAKDRLLGRMAFGRRAAGPAPARDTSNASSL